MFWPEMKPNQFVPSAQKKPRISTALIAVVRVGAVPLAHLMIVIGQVMVLDPVPSCLSIRVKD